MIDDANAVSMSILGFDGLDLKQAREDALITASQAPLFSSNYKAKAQPVYPNIYQSANSGGTLSLFGTRYALPAGTVREEFNDYEETTIPVPQRAPLRTTERTVLISEMDSLAQSAFKVGLQMVIQGSRTMVFRFSWNYRHIKVSTEYNPLFIQLLTKQMKTCLCVRLPVL
jgi:hypothetical protein